MTTRQPVSAPGKAFLIGEYAVLEGAPAVVTAVDVRAVAHAGEGPERTAPSDLSLAAHARVREHADAVAVAARAARTFFLVVLAVPLVVALVITLLTVDLPRRVENLVTAMLRICLRKHHQFDIRRITPDPQEIVRKIVDFLRRQCKSHFAVRLQQCVPPPLQHIHHIEWQGFEMPEQLLRVLE